MTKETRWPIIELFGPTIQGEGILLGHPTHFLRLAGCGYRCTWCDSMHAVDPKLIKINRKMMSLPELITSIQNLPGAPWLTLTGGDPCLYDNLDELIHDLQYNLGIRVAVETQGELWPSWLRMVDVATFSPKGPSSGNITDIMDFQKQLYTLRERANGMIAVKVVVKDFDDLMYAQTVLRAITPSNQGPPYDKFYFQVCSPLNSEMPKPPVDILDGDAPDAYQLGTLWKRNEILNRYEWLVSQLLKHPQPPNVAITPQVHTLLWPMEEKGR